jgi:hypothetical protein
MPETYKERQLETMFNPQTSDDRAVVLLLRAMDELTKSPAKDMKRVIMHGSLAGMATYLASGEGSTFDGEFVDKLTDSMGAEYTTAASDES